MLAAISVCISLFFAYIIPGGGSFGLPLYAIPLIIASILFGPYLGFIVGFLADLGIGILGPYGYMPLYGFSTITWAVVPGIFIKDYKKYTFLKLLIIIFYTYLMASLFNSFANYIYWGKKTFILTFTVRAFNIFLFTPVLTFLSNNIITSLLPNRKNYVCGIKVNILNYDKN